MDRLPDELISHILRYLEVYDAVQIQLVSRRLSRLARDTTLWRTICYDNSLAESSRQRKQLGTILNVLRVDLDPNRAALSEAVEAFQQNLSQNRAGQSSAWEKGRSRINWEPGYPCESIDYYEEYIQRHANIGMSWLGPQGDDVEEVTGLALLQQGNCRQNLAVAALVDGSVIIHDLSSKSISKTTLGRSAPGLLTPGVDGTAQRRTIMTEWHSIEVVSISDHKQCGFFAVGSMLFEVDLSRMSLVSSKQYAYPITALSTCDQQQPLIVGTNQTIQIYDARDTRQPSVDAECIRTELIAGPRPRWEKQIVLTQPGPLSILHAPHSIDSIWIAGRFTSMLQHSLRQFPRLESTVHSGARLSCMTFLPYAYTPRHLDLIDHPETSTATYVARKASSGWTAICAGDYKGKGSLELYSMSSETTRHDGEKYLNRQTASSSKLLSVANHGGKVVYSDGNGGISWKERNGHANVRTFNINEDVKPSSSEATSRQGLWANSMDIPGATDIVQKITPYTNQSSMSKHKSEKLLLWTGDGRLGILGFGPKNPLLEEEFHDAIEIQAESASDRARHDAERQYAMAMRRALERNADEVRFVRGLGMDDI